MSEPLRILQCIETGGPGGAETVFAELSGALRARGHQVHCLTAEGSWLPGELTRRGLPHEQIRAGGTLDVGLLVQLVRAIRRLRADVVHAHLFEGALYAAVAARCTGVPAVVTLHGQVDVAGGGWSGAVKRLVFSHASTAVVTVSETLGRDLLPSLRIPALRHRVIVNGVASRHTIRQTLEPKPSTFHVVAIGNIRRPKNYPLLLQAFAKVHEQEPRAHLSIIGQEDREGLFESLLELAQQLGITPHVTFHGFVADPETLLASADCFVLASTQEGFSLATIEAMLNGVPVVATRCGGPEEIVQHGLTGLLVPINDAEALSAAVLDVLQHPQLAQSLRERALADARDRFSVNEMCRQYERLYRTLTLSLASG